MHPSTTYYFRFVFRVKSFSNSLLAYVILVDVGCCSFRICKHIMFINYLDCTAAFRKSKVMSFYVSFDFCRGKSVVIL